MSYSSSDGIGFSDSRTELGNSFIVEFEFCSSSFDFARPSGSASKSDTTGVISPIRSFNVKTLILEFGISPMILLLSSSSVPLGSGCVSGTTGVVSTAIPSVTIVSSASNSWVVIIVELVIVWSVDIIVPSCSSFSVCGLFSTTDTSPIDGRS